MTKETEKVEHCAADIAFGVAMTFFGLFIVFMVVQFGYHIGYAEGTRTSTDTIQKEAVYLNHAHWERIGESSRYNFKWNDDTNK